MSDPNRKEEKQRKKLEKEAKYQRETAGLEFMEWPKIARLNREIVITEKIDGTNAAIGIRKLAPLTVDGIAVTTPEYQVYAQSRTRIITPDSDNFGFAAWVERNKEVLIQTLGEGLHFGEWWGVGIQRGYGLTERRFSLFNTYRWNSGEGADALRAARARGVAIYCVPVLWEGPWHVNGVAGYVEDTDPVNEDGSPKWLNEPGNPRHRFMPEFELEFLKREGSQAVPGFKSPEGIVVFHKAGGVAFKATCENDEQHKGQQS